jgi:hypothetical protein
MSDCNALNIAPAFMVFDQFAFEMFNASHGIQAELAQDFMMPGNNKHGASERPVSSIFNSVRSC